MPEPRHRRGPALLAAGRSLPCASHPPSRRHLAFALLPAALLPTGALSAQAQRSQFDDSFSEAQRIFDSRTCRNEPPRRAPSVHDSEAGAMPLLKPAWLGECVVPTELPAWNTAQSMASAFRQSFTPREILMRSAGAMVWYRMASYYNAMGCGTASPCCAMTPCLIEQTLARQSPAPHAVVACSCGDSPAVLICIFSAQRRSRPHARARWRPVFGAARNAPVHRRELR
jgi:hypothetical protein